MAPLVTVLKVRGLVDYNTVYTTGVRSFPVEDRLPAPVVKSNRGGPITFHGPGQLVAYPLMRLPLLGLSVKCYVSYLERAVIRSCRGLGVETHTSPHTGVWVGGRDKVC